MSPFHFLSIADLKASEIEKLIELTLKVKKRPKKYANKLSGKHLLLIFEAPSLRTELSFEVGMRELGGNSIHYHLSDSTVGKKESVKDFAKVISRYVDVVMARLYSHGMLLDLAEHADVPVINGMTNFEHPCQVLSDLVTITEKKKDTKGLQLSYIGDARNNVTHSLIFASALMGMDIVIACPQHKDYLPAPDVLREAKRLAKKTATQIKILSNAKEAAKHADVIYTDTWMSYHVPESQKREREKILRPYQVTASLMNLTNNAIFMHCLPAERGKEVTDDVIDSKKSVVYDQAENRLHAQKALMMWMLKR